MHLRKPHLIVYRQNIDSIVIAKKSHFNLENQDNLETIISVSKLYIYKVSY